MFKNVHHVCLYVKNVIEVENFLKQYFGIAPVSRQGFAEPEWSPIPFISTYHIGPSLVEFMQPRVRYGVEWDSIRRNEGPVISHVAWTVEDLPNLARDLSKRRAALWESKPSTSSLGGYILNNIVPETTRGILFQLCEDMEPRKEKNDSTILKYVHHVTYQLWGLSYMVDYMEQVFGIIPFKNEEYPEKGLRGVCYLFGSTIAQFEEPIKFNHQSAEFALRFGFNAGFIGGGVSHVGWTVSNLDHYVSRLKEKGLIFMQDEPSISVYGNYKVINISPESSCDITFQLCEDLK